VRDTEIKQNEINARIRGVNMCHSNLTDNHLNIKAIGVNKMQLMILAPITANIGSKNGTKKPPGSLVISAIKR